jgi:hypothetical protein
MGDVRWKLGDGSWEIEVGRLKMEVGRWKLEDGSWEMEVGSREVGTVKSLIITVVMYFLEIKYKKNVQNQLTLNVYILVFYLGCYPL